MKKLLFLLVPAFMLASCCNNATESEATEPEQTTEENQAEHKCCKEGEHKCCKEMTEEQKADMAAWEDWANQTDEKKVELLNKRKECVEKMLEHHGDVEELAATKEAIANWDNLSIDEQKAIFDNMPKCEHKCHKGEGEHKCHKGEGEHKCNHEGEHKCNHEGEHKCNHENHEGCPNHKE